MAPAGLVNSNLEEGDERRAVEMIEDKMESMRLVRYLLELGKA